MNLFLLEVDTPTTDLELKFIQHEVYSRSSRVTVNWVDLELNGVHLEVDLSSSRFTGDIQPQADRASAGGRSLIELSPRGPRAGHCPARGRNPLQSSQHRPRAESDSSSSSNAFGKPYSFDLELKSIQLEVDPPLSATMDLDLNRFQLEVELLSKGIGLTLS
ncbi:hypothetical protein PGT21_025697 [Puccinia graminis f. sp. tritici]|uniref:Uncharacterized protein n=1 Tax=Puccinia graminis f. sp. tritici TaxID=56615 RepID=A0A5B0LMD7_PUCGR|nr:hypothetical protein PGT21_025697 [Puccinia graminis f. sp. tritici]